MGNATPHPGEEGFSSNRSGLTPLPGALEAGAQDTISKKSLYRCNYRSRDHPRFRVDPKSSDRCPYKEKKAHENRRRDSRSASPKLSYIKNGRQLLEARREARNAFSFGASRRNQPCDQCLTSRTASVNLGGFKPPSLWQFVTEPPGHEYTLVFLQAPLAGIRMSLPGPPTIYQSCPPPSPTCRTTTPSSATTDRALSRRTSENTILVPTACSDLSDNRLIHWGSCCQPVTGSTGTASTTLRDCVCGAVQSKQLWEREYTPGASAQHGHRTPCPPSSPGDDLFQRPAV